MTDTDGWVDTKNLWTEDQVRQAVIRALGGDAIAESVLARLKSEPVPYGETTPALKNWVTYIRTSMWSALSNIGREAVQKVEICLGRMTQMKVEIVMLQELLVDYSNAVVTMNEAMKDGVNVHGALAEIAAYEEQIEEVRSVVAERKKPREKQEQ